MPFDINQLNNLDYEEAEPILDDYIDGLIEQFAKSPEGEAYAQEHSDFGRWIVNFTEMSYMYEGFTLSKMTKAKAQIVMEHILPRKLMLTHREEAEDAIPELIAFWNFLKREYNFRSAGAIATYLTEIKDKFTDWMFDPAKGGIAKNLIMGGIKAGFDMTNSEGIAAFQKAYNQQLLREVKKEPNNSFLQQLGSLSTGSEREAQVPISNTKSSKPKPKTDTKGFDLPDKDEKSKGKKK